MINWLNTLSEYNDAVASDLGIPIIRPENIAQEVRWRKVIEEMYAKELRSSDNQDVVIINVGINTYSMALLYAKVMGYFIISVNDIDNVTLLLKEVREKNILFITLAHELKVGFVANALEISSNSGKNIGFLCGRTLSGLSYLIAKSLLKPALLEQNEFLIDAPKHKYTSDESQPEKLVKLLSQPAMLKTIRSHGEGSHAKLPSLTVCGLLEETEFPLMPECGCSRLTRRCKRAHGKTQVFYGADIRAYAINYICCNGFNMAGELYPSPVSMILALTEGWPAAVLAPIRPLIAPDHFLSLFRKMAKGKMPLGQIVASLNDACAELGQPFTFALIGDPTLQLSLQDENPSLPESLHEHVEPESNRQIMIGIKKVLEEGIYGYRLLRSIDAWLGETVADKLSCLREKLINIERLALFSLKKYEVSYLQEDKKALVRNNGLIQLLMTQWEKILVSLLHEGREDFDVFDLLHYDQLMNELKIVEPCRRCGTLMEVSSFGQIGGITGCSETYMCRVCGPLAAYRYGGIRLEYLTEKWVARQGERMTVKIRLHTSHIVHPISQRVHLELRGYDKSTGQCFVSEIKTAELKHNNIIRFEFTLDENQGCDLHSIRVIAVSGFDIAFLRIRLACLPK
ncbi:hypothetical protein ID852_09240 [Xenorhabdus sp. 42]|uniref:hypothetical protein n=1 Tax=Xenorhabdus szentirmaii TaxID=290112 RepID=UPI0019CF0222|nr:MULTISPECIES: hypothetical protein [unclassified Xenorhabdus]MBD2791975.1 hypothetical protein [Xenorhabdus sp. CUL]MBD2820873.1 hypothetical protein [Xenorhabdus sp. 42]MBD2823645.1 hypothetical protein [Xenorhabdus sp. 5]